MTVDVNRLEPVINAVEAIGPVEIGQQDPRGMSREEFSNASGLLYHGADAEFEFDQNFDYSNQPINSVNSHTIGRGFYATPKRQDAVF